MSTSGGSSAASLISGSVSWRFLGDSFSTLSSSSSLENVYVNQYTRMCTCTASLQVQVVDAIRIGYTSKAIDKFTGILCFIPRNMSDCSSTFGASLSWSLGACAPGNCKQPTIVNFVKITGIRKYSHMCFLTTSDVFDTFAQVYSKHTNQQCRCWTFAKISTDFIFTETYMYAN